MQCKKVDGICVAESNANCVDCDLRNDVLCHFSKKFANKFLLGNSIYRILAIIIAIFTGILTNQWWMFIIYTLSILLVFFLIEPRLLCSHCPFYAKEGKFLKCWALRGMPKFWKYRPEPSSQLEKSFMLIIGGFIDLFPFIVAVVGIIGSIIIGIQGYFSLLIFSLLIVVTIIFTILVGVFDKLLRGGTCKKCINFSCSMNKTPEVIRKKFFQQNPTIAKAWKK